MDFVCHPEWMHIEPDTEVLMLHVLSRKGGFVTSETVTYGVQSVRVRRPVEGTRFGHMRCVACEKPVHLRLHSVEDTRRRKRRWTSVAIVAGLVLVAAVLSVAIYGERYDAVPVAGGLTIAAALVTLYAGWISAVRENGVVIRVRDLDQLHSVIPLQTMGGWRRRDRRNATPTSFAYED
jgi:hypothetical protein